MEATLVICSVILYFLRCFLMLESGNVGPGEGSGEAWQNL